MSAITEIENEFKLIDSTITEYKTHLTALQTRLRTIEKKTKKELKTLMKSKEKTKRTTNKTASGFAKPTKISSELCKFMGKEEGTEIARTDVTKYIIAYIKENKLGESKNIKPDEKLQKLLGINEEITYFNIQKYMNKHFIKKT
jgi:chromatin remodeling complex protein RSC6